MSAALSVREAGLTDAAHATTIVGEYSDTLAIVLRDTPAELYAYLAPPNGLWLLCDNTQPVGCVALRVLSVRSAEVKRLYVQPAYRGLRGADALLDALEHGALERGFDELFLDTHDGLQAATRFYERRGFARCERYNDNRQATIFMRRTLQASRTT